MRNKLIYSFLFLLCLVLASSMASAYYIKCINRGEIISFETICTSDCCHTCMTTSGYSTDPRYCLGLEDCECSENTTQLPLDPTPTNLSTCNCTDINTRIMELETQVWNLERDHEQQEIRITTLQTLAEDLRATITAIQEAITSILTRLTAVEAGTPGTNPGCTESWSCSSWGACQEGNLQTRTCTDINSCGTTYLRPAQTQSCVYDPRVVKFRTNVQEGNYNTATAELVFDYNKDGTLDCFKYASFYSSYTSRLPVVLAVTPEGINVEKYVLSQVIVRSYKNPYFQLSAGCVTPTTKAPVEPYASTGREVYE